MRRLLLAAAFAALAAPALADDPHQWLEAVQDPRALEWVATQDAASTAALQGDARYRPLHDEALAVLSAADRIAMPDFVGEAVFNFWQDGEHVRGLWRRTTLKSYRSGKPRWETVIDLDALARSENMPWVWKGATCRPPAYDRCLVELSDGGKDAVELREFDLTTRTFVTDGFYLPPGKQTVAWLDPDTLILNRDWGPGTTTESGYGFVVKTLKRGRPLDEAVEVFRGQPGDVSAYPHVVRDGRGNQVTLIERGLDFFHTEFHHLSANGPVKLDMPERATVHGLLDNTLIFTIEQDWTYRHTTAKAGSILAYALVDLTPNSQIYVLQAEEVFVPGPRQSVEEVEVTAGRVVAVINDNVQGRLIAFTNGGEWGWWRRELVQPANAAVHIVSVSDLDNDVFYTVEGFLAPVSLALTDTVDAPRTIATLPPRFDASGLVAEQFEATSRDGTKIPYFLVRQKGRPLDGSAPLLLHAYGGFQISKTPLYDPLVGKLWLEKGGAYAVANIRGGGEFGPAWHQAALKESRQRAYDDFHAVAEDLIARKVTSPRRLGIYGRSNGGLLMGVAMTQRPDLYRAVVVESPLLDMLRYHELPAGASWIGEYGDPRLAEEAAWIGAYSPYQALKPGVAYPLAYITTNTLDDRVHPGHARKFAARLAELGALYLYFENTEGGHANGADPRANARRWAMHYVYLSKMLMDEAP